MCIRDSPSKKPNLIDQLIAAAPETAVEPEPVKLNPNPEPASNQEQAKEDNTAEADDFHNDPLIVEALKVFKGRLIS